MIEVPVLVVGAGPVGLATATELQSRGVRHPGGAAAPATPELAEIFKTHLLADSVRRAELRVEMTKSRPFVRPGDLVRASLHDLWSGRDLGWLENPIVEGR